MQIFVIVVVVVVFVVSCNWFFPANHKSVSVLFLFTCILYCIAFLLFREAFLRMRIPSYNNYCSGGYTLSVEDRWNSRELPANVAVKTSGVNFTVTFDNS